MSYTDYLGIGMGGPTLLMSDGDIANNIRGFAIQALENCVFSQFDLDQTPVCPVNERYVIEICREGSNEFQLSSSAIEKLSVGDKVLLHWGGVDIPLGTVKDSEGRPTEFKDDSIYFIQAIDTGSNEVKLEETKGAGAITLDDGGTTYGDKTWSAKVSDQDFSYGTFTRNASANDRTHEIIGNVDGRIFRTDDDSGLQVNMFDTTGTSTVGDVTIEKGWTVYLPVTDITLTSGACIVYTRK